jgi:ribose transport system substrate-binding protein
MKKNLWGVIMLVAAALLLTACGSKGDAKDTVTSGGKKNSDLKMAWFAPAPHPYFEEVQKGVEKFKEEQGVDVIIQIGPD